MRVALALAAAACALAVAGCGDEEDAAGPASLVPGSALIYGEAVLRPQDEERTAIEAPLAALLDTEDPGAQIVEELDEQLADDGSEITWAKDIEPWLGERGAFFFSSVLPEEDEDVAGDEANGFTEDGEDGAFVVESTDAEAGQSFAEKIAGEEGDEVEEASYEGVDYLRTENGDAAGVVGDAVVFGSQAGFEQVVDTEAGGEALADDADFDAVLGDDAGATALLFADLPAIVAAAEEAGELDPSDREALDTVLAGIAEEPLAAVFDAETTGFGLELSYGAPDFPLLVAAGEESALLGELPGDSWLAAGFADAGDAIGSLFSSAGEFGVPAGELEAFEEQIRRETGLELEELHAPLGDAAIFANGEGIFGTGGGIVFEADDPAGARRLLDGIERVLRSAGEQVNPLPAGGGRTGFALTIPGAPSRLNFVAGGDRIVVAYGDGATAAALDPGAAEDTLGESEDFTAAAASLGEGFAVGAYVDFASAVEILELASTAAPDLQEALPYLESLDYFVAGSTTDGERQIQKLFLGVADVVADPSA